MKFLTSEWLNSANIDLMAAENLLQNEAMECYQYTKLIYQSTIDSLSAM